MPGLSDYSAIAIQNWVTGQLAMPALPSVWCGLYTVIPQDSGAGGTEVAALGYARVQVAGPLTTNNTTGPGANTLNFAAVPAWIQPGMSIRSNSAPATIPPNTVVVSKTATTVVMNNNAAGAGVANGASIQFSAFGPPSPASGSEPDTLPSAVANLSTVTFPQAAADWGNVVAFGLFDASAAGNLLEFDYIGDYLWHPFTCTLASPGVITSPQHGLANGDLAVVTEKYGGSLPITAGSWAGTKTVAGATTDTFNLGVNTTSTGDGLFRRITSQSIPQNVTASFAPGTLNLTAA